MYYSVRDSHLVGNLSATFMVSSRRHSNPLITREPLITFLAQGLRGFWQENNK